MTMTTTDRKVNVGDIFEESWGYDQTNIDFYQVTKLTPSGVRVRKVDQSYVSQDGPCGDRVVADVDRFTGPEKFHRLSSGGWGTPTIKVRSWGSWAHLWDGDPSYQTDTLYGH